MNAQKGREGERKRVAGLSGGGGGRNGGGTGCAARNAALLASPCEVSMFLMVLETQAAFLSTWNTKPSALMSLTVSDSGMSSLIRSMHHMVTAARDGAGWCR